MAGSDANAITARPLRKGAVDIAILVGVCRGIGLVNGDGAAVGDGCIGVRKREDADGVVGIGNCYRALIGHAVITIHNDSRSSRELDRSGRINRHTVRGT